MEIEAKFLIENEEVFHRLGGIKSIASFEVGDFSESIFTDIYLDTSDMAVCSSGYSFRQREKPGRFTYTLKSLDNSGLPIHKREEIEESYPERKAVEELGESRLKHLLFHMIGSGLLFPLFEVSHKRKTALIAGHSREIVELSLDDVTIICQGDKKSYLEVELELHNGTEEELKLMVSALKDDFGLMPGSSSKFDNGMDMMRDNMKGLAARMDYGEASDKRVSGSIPLKVMFEEYDIEMPHARKVAENSLVLFDKLASLHRLEPDFREVMRIAALVHDVGFTSDMKDHHKEGRDILLAHPPTGLPFPLYRMLPWTTFLHKKKIDDKRLEKLHNKNAFMNMPPGMQNDILRIAAILRIADGLDYSRMDSSIAGISLQEDKAIIEVQGPGAQTDAKRADVKCDLWRMLFKKDLHFRPANYEPA
jgi:exopolyphosphatase/guanosine-5'-triphosphate,3'-diphosphate pyrophosphatase